MKSILMTKAALAVIALTCLVTTGSSAVKMYGDADALGTGAYGANDPTAGATLQGLASGTMTFASLVTGHGYPFSPDAGDFPDTDQIFVGSTQTAFHDGYSTAGSRLNGPQLFTLDYSSLIPSGSKIGTLTLGIAADDFQATVFGQPFTTSINGTDYPALATALNSLNQTGPVTQFFTIGIDPAALTGNHQLSLAINELGDGGDGWAVDFLTVGVTTKPISMSPVPEPATTSLWGAVVALSLAGFRVRSKLRGLKRKSAAC
ncbi:MAG TPA: hypothetical protein VGM64_00945 [Lacunisphaera sp.]|jgi:hypothetical protein